MKNFFSAFIFVFCFGAVAQSYQNTEAINQNPGKDTSVRIQNTDFIPSNHDAFIVEALERGIPQRTFENLPNVKNGYYLVSGVFSKSNKLAKQVRKLTKKGFDSGYFKNEESGLHYLYVTRHNAWENAIKDHQTKFDNKFKDEVWILHITNSLPVDELASNKAVAET